MNKRIPLGIVIALLCLCVAGSAVLTGIYVRKDYNTLLAGLPEQAARYEILDELDSVLRAHYYGSSDRQAMQRAIAKGYISGLPDGNSRYLTRQELETYQHEADGELRGIGVTCSRTKNSRLRVEDVVDGSPAQQQEMAAGELIVREDIDGHVAAGALGHEVREVAGDAAVDLRVRAVDGHDEIDLLVCAVPVAAALRG